MGAAGDMLTAALLELAGGGALEPVKIPGVKIISKKINKNGVLGTQIDVDVRGHKEHEHEHESHEHRGHSVIDINELINALDISDAAKSNAKAVYALIAEAESAVHGKPATEIHFHEVGNLDAVADIVSVCVLIEKINPDKILASPIRTGFGQVKCAHGILPVPAPATALILKGVPIYAGDCEGEMCTPTGAAILKHFVSEFREFPNFKISNIGYGFGHKEFKALNCARAFLGESPPQRICDSSGTPVSDDYRDEVVELVCALDDATPEQAAFASDVLFQNGALDVYRTPVVMKKGRLGFELRCLARPGDAEKMAGLIFKHTTTIGMREYKTKRRVLKRTTRAEKNGVNVKTSEGFGTKKSKPEFDDLTRIAIENEISVIDAAQKGF
jgi:uncharacterized protein (TIGR00299 family) protein